MKAKPFRYPLVPQDIPQGIKCAQRVQQYGKQGNYRLVELATTHEAIA